MTALAVENLSAGYGRRVVVSGITLPELDAGTVTVLTGPNGAGKSTLLRALAGLVPGAGRAMLDASDLLALDLAARARQVAFMPQTLPGEIGLSVIDSVITALKVARPDLPVAAARERSLAALERLGILKLGLSPLGSLSGGQKQLASLAQAIVSDPRVLLLDEPASALDLRHQFQVMRTIRSLAAEGRIVVAVLHDLEMAARWADRIVVMRDGRLYSAGVPARVVDANMLAEVYGVRARVDNGRDGELRIVIDDIADDAGEPLTGVG